MRREVSMIDCQCDRCGKESRISSGQYWGSRITAKTDSGSNVFPGGSTIDLCYECTRELHSWVNLLNEDGR